MRRGTRSHCAVPIAAALALAAPRAAAQTLEMHVDSDPIYAETPFVLSVEATGFDEKPEPKVAAPAIDGCRVTPLPVTPNVSTMLTIVNGQRSESRNVSFVFRFRVEAGRPGSYAIPPIAVEQGGRRASTRAVRFNVVDVQATRDMALRLTLPDRPLWVGEAFELGIDWYLKRDVRGQTFVVPLLERPEWAEVAAPHADERGERLTFLAGAKNLDLPFRRDQATLDGTAYTRFHFTARVIPLRAGTLDLPPARVLAQLSVGVGRDAFGFPTARTALFKAEDQARHLVVRAPPAEGRPPSFGGAVGHAFALEVQADRTVVRVGDPIELRLVVRGDRLEGLTLPALGAGLGLSPDLFSLPDEVPPGEMLADQAADAAGRRGGKLFRVAVRLRSAQVREIPALAFSYFDPVTARYQTVRSQPIALSVRGASVVGAGEVVAFGADQSAHGGGGDRAAPEGQPAPRRPLATVGADLSLSDERATLRVALTARQVWPLLVALYALSLALLAWRLFLARTQAERAVTQEIKRALAAVEAELAADVPAREAAPRLLAALTALARALGGPRPFADLIQRLEAAGFDPRTAGRPLDASLIADVRDAVRRSIAASSGPARPARRGSAGAGVAALLLASLAGGVVRADASRPPDLDEARTIYRQALVESDLERRAAGFARAEGLLDALAERYPDRPELLTDWGNAALGARDFGKATLAYRRALRLASGSDRARRNLAWVRSAMPEWLPRPGRLGAMDSLFFWHHELSTGWRHVLGALAFALAAMLAAPWATSRERRRLLRRAAAAPALVFLAMIGSLVAEGDPGRDAVVQLEGVTLRAADSAGAPPAQPQPLPAGAEVTILEERPGWARVALANRTEGWLEAGSLAAVEPR